MLILLPPSEGKSPTPARGRPLLEAGADPANPLALAGVLRDLGHLVETRTDVRPGRPVELDVVVPEL